MNKNNEIQKRIAIKLNRLNNLEHCQLLSLLYIEGRVDEMLSSTKECDDDEE